LKLFVCEFITGGGLYRQPLSAALAQEGRLMREALLQDLADLAGDAKFHDIELVTSYDSRLEVPPHAHLAVPIHKADDVWRCWEALINQADAVWLIAPETDDVLLELTGMVQAAGKRLLGCNAASVFIAANKLECSELLGQAGIAVVPGYRLENLPSGNYPHGLVAKPNDGAGCEDMAWFGEMAELTRWMQPRRHSHIVQPYLPGTAASLSMLCRDGRAWLLSCNEQRVKLHHAAFQYSGSVINGMHAYWQAGQQLASQVAAALPGLAGYVGVDVIIDDAGCMHVIEINPRLTTSYVGLHAAINCNPAGLVLELLLYNDAFLLPTLQHSVIETVLDA